MITKKIKDLKGARRVSGGVVVTKTATYSQMRVNLDFELEAATSTGSHTNEYRINVDGASFSVTYYNSSTQNNYAVSYYAIDGTPISGIMGGSGTSGKTTATVTPPLGTRIIRVFGTSNAAAQFVAVNPPGIYKLKEIRMKPAGASASQVVWPTVTTYRIVDAQPVFSRWNKFYANGSNYATAVATVKARRGEDVQILTYQPLTPLRIARNDYLVINGVRTAIYSIDGNNRVRAADLGTTEAKYGTGARIVFGYQGEEVEIEVEQEPNVIDDTGYVNKNYNGYRIELDNTDFTPSGGSATVSGYKLFNATVRYLWTSGSYSYGGTVTGEEPQSPTSITVSKSPSTAPSATVSGNTITFPANIGTDENTYAVRGSWSSYSDTQYAYVYGADTGRNYTSLSVSMQYPDSDGLGRGYIAASGGSMYPVVSVIIYCNGTRLSGTVSDGSTAVVVSGGSYQTTIALTYDGAPNGFVSAMSRGTTEDASNTLLASVRVTATKGSLSAQSSYVNVYQQRNQKSVYSQGSYTINSMSVTPKIGGSAISGPIPAKSTTVTLEILVSGSGTTTRYSYTSGAYSGGDTVTDTDQPLSQADLASLSVTSGGSAVTVSNLEFTASNQHNLTAKTYSISANYEGTTRTASVQQAADRKIDGSATYYATLSEVSNQNTLWAGGGSVYVEASAYHIAGKVWESDGAAVTGESETTYDLDALRLVLAVDSASIFAAALDSTTSTSRIYRIDHRDMKNIVTTDACSVVAVNGADTAVSQATSTALAYSVTNALESTEYSVPGTTVWGTPYQQYRNYAINFSIANYTSGESPAPFLGGSTRYSASGYHQEATFRDGVQPVPVYRHYSSWSSANDDDNHRYLVRTDENTYTETVSDWATVWGDTVSVAKQYASVDWVTVDESTQTITFAAQTQEGSPQRYTPIVATNTSAPNTVTASVTVWQQAYQMLYASPLTFSFEWRNPQPGITDITAWYVKFQIVKTGDWFSLQISFNSGADWEAVDYDAAYGVTTGAEYPKLRILSSTNFGDDIRIGAVNLVPIDAEGVNTVRLRLDQEAHDGEAPTE